MVIRDHLPRPHIRCSFAAALIVLVYLAVSTAIAQSPERAEDRREESRTAAALHQPAGGETSLQWARDAIWYHVIVSRFCNEDPTNDVTVDVDPAVDNVHRGPGDLAGLRARLAYLKTLGVNTLLLSDVFAVRSDTRLPALDLNRVRSDLLSTGRSPKPPSESAGGAASSAGADEFIALLKDTQLLGFRVVLALPMAQTYLPEGKDEAVAFLNEACARWARRADDGRGVDGWIVQWPNRLPRDAWKTWCAKQRDLNPTILLAVDVPGNAEQWVDAELFDTAVNHHAGELVRRYVARQGGEASCERIGAALASSSGRHDPRAAPMFSGTAGSARLVDALSKLAGGSDTASREGESRDTRDVGLQRWRLAMGMQFFLPGSPGVFAGDEYAMPAHPQFGVAPPMLWRDAGAGQWLPAGEVDAKLSWSRWLIERRDIHRALREGSFEIVLCDDGRGVLAFSRTIPGEKVTLVVNVHGQAADVTLPIARPGQLVGVLVPRFEPLVASRAPRSDSKSVIKPITLGGSRQYADSGGHIRLQMPALSVAVVLVNDAAP